MEDPKLTPQEDQLSLQDAKKDRSPMRTIVITGICILILLVVANLNTLLSPLRLLQKVLAPITIGLVIAYLCNPFLRFYEYKIFAKIKNRRINLAISMIAAYLTLMAILAGIVLLITPQVVGSINDLRINGMSYITTLIDWINHMIAVLPLPGEGDHLVSFEKLLTYLINWISGYGTRLLGDIGSIAGNVLTVLKNILVGIFVSIYVLLSKDRLNAMFRRIFRALLPERGEKILLHYLSIAHTKVGGFLIGKLFDSAMVGLVSGILFTIFKIPYPILIAVIIGVTDVIPFFGPFIGAIPSALIIFIVSPPKALLFVVLILVVQQIDGNLLAPWILGDRTGLSSLGVLVAVTVFGNLMGFAGLLLGVPIFALLMTMGDDLITHRLKQKGEKSELNAYYPADAFLRPEEENQNSLTMTQKFVQWVRSVEDEPKAPATTRKRFSRWVRRCFLFFGHLFHRIFSIRQLPEDEAGSIYRRIAKEGMRSDRRFWRTLLLCPLTLFLYPLYLVEVAAQSTNLACKRDKRRTWGVLPYLVCCICTLGIFHFVWHCQVINRWQRYCRRNGVRPAVSKKQYLLLSVLGLPTVIAPIIGYYYFQKGLNQMGALYNGANGTAAD